MEETFIQEIHTLNGVLLDRSYQKLYESEII